MLSIIILFILKKIKVLQKANWPTYEDLEVVLPN